MQDQDQPVPGPFLLQSKAAQRGADATREILKNLVSDCGIPEGECIVVLDLLPGRPHGMSSQKQFQKILADEPKEENSFFNKFSILRFNEWGRATWQLQLPYLQSSTGYDWHFAAYQSEADGDMEEQLNFIAARVLEDSSQLS